MGLRECLSCGRMRGRCTEVYQLTKMFSFECLVCHYYHSDFKATDLCMNCLDSNIIKELSEVAKADADSGTDEAGPSRKVAEVQRDINLDDEENAVIFSNRISQDP